MSPNVRDTSQSIRDMSSADWDTSPNLWDMSPIILGVSQMNEDTNPEKTGVSNKTFERSKL